MILEDLNEKDLFILVFRTIFQVLIAEVTLIYAIKFESTLVHTSLRIFVLLLNLLFFVTCKDASQILGIYLFMLKNLSID